MELDYRFGEMETTNTVVGQQLNSFRTTLDDFKKTYVRLASAWGGTASEGAGQVAVQIDDFGKHTADVVNSFLNGLVTHLDDSRATERTNTGLFPT